jgi:hypothetical protein
MRLKSQPRGALVRRLAAMLAVALISATQMGGCNSSSSDGPPAPAGDCSGTYFTTFGTTKNSTLVLTQLGAAVGWTLTVDGMNLGGMGSVAGSTVSLSMTTPMTMTAMLQFSSPTDFSGTWAVTGATPQESSDGSMTGSTTQWTTYDWDTLGTPMFVDTDYIELVKIDRISMFRSGEGHDYSDDFESCRSMKHYYVPESAVVPTSIVITSPVDGVVTGYINEDAGVQVGIESNAYPGIIFIAFHVDLVTPLNPGDAVTKGQALGTHNGGVVSSDIAVGIASTTGWRLVSFLDTMTNGLFAAYQARGMTVRSDGIISKAARDADPLTCIGEMFVSPGSLPGYFQFN